MNSQLWPIDILKTFCSWSPLSFLFECLPFSYWFLSQIFKMSYYIKILIIVFYIQCTFFSTLWFPFSSCGWFFARQFKDLISLFTLPLHSADTTVTPGFCSQFQVFRSASIKSLSLASLHFWLPVLLYLYCCFVSMT